MGYFPYHLVSQISGPSTVVIWSHCLMVSALPLWNHTEAEAATPPCQPSRSLTLEALVTIFKISPLPTSTSSFFSLSSQSQLFKKGTAFFKASYANGSSWRLHEWPLANDQFVGVFILKTHLGFPSTQSCFPLPTCDYLASPHRLWLGSPWAPTSLTSLAGHRFAALHQSHHKVLKLRIRHTGPSNLTCTKFSHECRSAYKATKPQLWMLGPNIVHQQRSRRIYPFSFHVDI